LGLGTGMIWANFTWGAPWPNDPKLNGSAIATLMYLAYIILRGSIDEEQKRAKISAIYNIFAFPIMVVLIFVLPRLTDSLHPGNGGNPGFGAYDLDSNMRYVFYPAVLGWILVATWIMTIRFRIRVIENKNNQIQ
jgi:heme exporter protein C